MATIEIKVPDIGDFDEVAVIELLVKPGDTVKAEQSLITVESDKASMEIPSSHAGVVKALQVKLGDKVKEGSVVLLLESAEAAAAAPAAPASTPNPATATVAAAQAAPVSVAPAASSGPVNVTVPDIGDFKDVAVIELLVKVGDTVKVEQSLITVESDKASMEIPSSAAGVVKEIKVKLGDTVNIGDLVLVLEGTAGAVAAPVAAAVSVPNVAPAPASYCASSSCFCSACGCCSPQPHGLGREGAPRQPLGAQVRPRAGRAAGRSEGLRPQRPALPKADVQVLHPGCPGRRGADRRHCRSCVQVRKAAGGDGAALGLIPWPKVDFAKFGPIERKEMGRIKKISGANLLRNAVLIPAVTNHDDADITDLEAFRVSTNKENEKSGVKVTMLAFLIKACVAALKKFPEFNSSLDGDAWSTRTTGTSASPPTRPMA